MLNLFRQINVVAVLAHILLLVLLAALFYLLGLTLDLAALLAAMFYFLMSMLLRRFVPTDHNRGLSLLQGQNYEQARQAFEQSYDFFTQKAWIDDYRLFTLLSASKLSYKEMALVNVALTYWLQKDIEAAKAAYQRVLVEFPQSKWAKDALDYIENPDEEEEEEEEEKFDTE